MKCDIAAGVVGVPWCRAHNRTPERYHQDKISKLQKGANLEMLQAELPWGANDYNKTFRNSPVLHKDFQHALIHILKALGKLSSFVEAADHADSANFPYDEISKYLADVLICTVRMANTKPGARVDLSKAVLDRIEEKMGVRLPQEQNPSLKSTE